MKKLFFSMTILLAVTLISCTVDDDKKRSETMKATATSESFNKLRDNVLKDITQTKEYKDLKSTDVIDFTSTKGAKLSISVGVLRDANGNPVTGDVKLEFVEIYDRTSMLLTNKTTVGKTADGKLNGLFTGGEFNIKLTQNGKELSAVGNHQLVVPTALTNDKKQQDMTVWEGKIDENGNLAWEEEKGKTFVEGGEMSNNYLMSFTKFNWVNIDRFWDYEGDKTKIKVTVPTGYTAKNCAVYFAVVGEKNTLALLDVFKDGYFSEHYGYIPVGIEAYIVFVSEKDGKWLYAVKNLRIKANETINITFDDLKMVTVDELKKELEKLS